MRVAITGIGAVSPVGHGVDALAEALRAGRSGLVAGGPDDPAVLGPLPEPAWDGLADDAGSAGAAAVDRARRVVARTGTEVAGSVRAALEAWLRAALPERPLPAQRLGVVVAGHNLAQAWALEVEAAHHGRRRWVSPRFALQSLDVEHLGAVSEALGIHGEGCLAGGSSASGNVAIVQGCRMLADGHVDACLVVGAPTRLTATQVQSLVNAGALGGRAHPHEACRPFDAACTGFVPSRAAAALVLESPASAAARGVDVLALVLGYGVVLDGRNHVDPLAEGEARAMAQAIARAGLHPRDIQYVNAHGTGSRLGDEVEVQALRLALGEHVRAPWINSTKGWVGHAVHAAGVLEAVAVVLQLRGSFVHPNANLAEPIDPSLRFAPDRAVEASIRYALSNGFGFGGINTSLVLGHPAAASLVADEGSRG